MSTFQADFARIAQLQTRLKASQMQIEMARSQIISAKSKLSGQSGFGLSAVKAAIQQEVKTTAEERETAGRMRAFMGVVVDRTSQHENSAAGKLESTDIKKTIELFISRLRKILLLGGAGALAVGLTNLLNELMEWIQKPPVSENPGHGGNSGNGGSGGNNGGNNGNSGVTGNGGGTDGTNGGSPYNGMTLENRNGQNFYSYNITPLHQDDFPEFLDEQSILAGNPKNVGCSVTAMMMLYLFLNPGQELSPQDMETKMLNEWWENGTGAVWGNEGFTSQDIKGEQAILSEAVNQLQQGKPSIIKIQGVGDDRHYVLIKGYREGCDFSHLTPDDILVQDPGFTADSATLTLREAMSHHPDSYLPGQLITC